jgi:chemotaxis response regulator CheB
MNGNQSGKQNMNEMRQIIAIGTSTGGLGALK